MWCRTSLRPGSKATWDAVKSAGTIVMTVYETLYGAEQGYLMWAAVWAPMEIIHLHRSIKCTWLHSSVQNPSRYFQCLARDSSSNIPLNNSFNGTKQTVSLACTPSQRWCYDDSLSKFQFTTHRRTTDSSLCSEWVRGRDFGHSLSEQK